MRITLSYKLLLVCLGALVLRVGLLQFVTFPGVADPNHYYNVGVGLVEGHGFTIDYIWQYNDNYASVDHPDDYWMPLTGLIAAASMAIFGIGVHQALLPFVLIGSLLPALGYWAARQFGAGEDTSLFAAASVAVLPELVLNSLRTDTTIPNALLLCTCLLLLTVGLRGRRLAFVGSGIAAGLAYLTRSENALILVMIPITLALYFWWQPGRHWQVILVPLIAVLIAVPWSLRNLSLNGTLSTPTTSNMFFLTDYRDHYVYDRHLTLQTYLASESMGQIIGKRLFEMAASIKVMITSLDVFLPIAVIGGALLVLRERSRKLWLTLAPAVILLIGFYAFYTLLVPFKNEGGSFKKAYLSLIPLLLPLAAYALERAITDRRLRIGAMTIAIILMTLTAVDTVRLDASANLSYVASVQQAVDVLHTLPNGKQATIMTQDPFMLGYLGVRNVIFPFEDRDTIFQVAERYGVSYLLMPSNTPALDDLLTGKASDPRFVPAASVPGTPYIFYAVKDVPSG